MPDHPTFGRASGRGIQLASEQGLRHSTASSAATSNTAASDDRLRSNSTWLSLFGDILGFGGLVAVFAATALWPADPASLSALEGLIRVPPSLPTASGVEAQLSRLNVNVAEVSSGWYSVAFLFVGVTAVIAKRWLLAVLLAVFFLFPFARIGLIVPDLPLIAAAVATTGFVVAINGAVGKVIMVPLVGVIYALCVGLMLALTPDGSERLSYQAIALSDLPSDGVVVPEENTRPDESQQQSGARSLVLAQQRSLMGRPAAAALHLERARAGGYPTNLFEERVMRSIGDHAAVSGVYGEAARQERVAQFRLEIAIASTAIVLGSILALAAPFSQTISNGMTRRLRRLREMRREIAGHSGSVRGFSSDRYSLAVDDGHRTVKTIAQRMDYYTVALLSSIWVCAYCGLRAYQFHLPAADQNTAFVDIALEGPAALLAANMDLAADAQAILPQMLVHFWNPASVLLVFPLAGLLFRRYRVLSLVAMILLTAFDFRPGVEPIRQFASVIPLESTTVEFRQVLHAVESGRVDQPGMPGGRVAAENLTAASYVLAQIAYLEDRPIEMMNHLSSGMVPGRLDGQRHHQRYTLMVEWAEAHGAELEVGAPRLELPATSEAIRNRSRFFLAASIAGGVVSGLSLAMLLLAGLRKRRINNLMLARTSVTQV